MGGPPPPSPAKPPPRATEGDYPASSAGFTQRLGVRSGRGTRGRRAERAAPIVTQASLRLQSRLALHSTFLAGGWGLQTGPPKVRRQPAWARTVWGRFWRHKKSPQLMNHPHFGWSWGHSLVAREVLGTPPLVLLRARTSVNWEPHSRSLGAPSPHGRAPGPWGTSMSSVHSPPNPDRHTQTTHRGRHTHLRPLPLAWRPHPHQPWYSSTKGPLSPAAPGSRPP